MRNRKCCEREFEEEPERNKKRDGFEIVKDKKEIEKERKIKSQGVPEIGNHRLLFFLMLPIFSLSLFSSCFTLSFNSNPTLLFFLCSPWVERKAERESKREMGRRKNRENSKENSEAQKKVCVMRIRLLLF